MTAPAPPRRRVTPTAVRILPADAGRDEWLEARRWREEAGYCIGSSDVAAIVGAADRRTALHVYHDKRGRLDDEDPGEAARWGTLLEDPVAREWQRRNRSVVHRVGLVANVDRPWAQATLDRRVVECPLRRDTREACALEVKCRSAFKAARWRTDVPDDVLAQTVWQMEVTGYDHVHVAVLIGGNEYRQAVVRRDGQVADYITAEVERFRTEHLIAEVPPPADLDKADALLELDALLHPDRVGTVSVRDSLEADVYARLSRDKGLAERQLKRQRARLAELAGGARYVQFEGELLFELAPRSKASIDLDRLAEQFPDAYAACVTDKPYHQIQLGPKVRLAPGKDDDDQ